MWLKLNILMVLTSILGFFMPMSIAVDPNCDFFQYLQMGQDYYIYNSEYPNNFQGRRDCRWLAESDPGSTIVLSCEDIDLPASTNCVNDKLAVSLTGNENFNDAHNYCGKGKLTLVTQANKLAVGLKTPWNSKGGRFICTLTAFNSGPPTTTTERPNVCDCGWKQNTRIVGGHETGVNEYPAMAALINIEQDGEVYCGSSIISERYALTAGHCVYNMEPNLIGLLVGDHNLTSGSDTDAAALYRIESMLAHPNYDETQYHNDIGIVRTEKPIVFSIKVGPVCLPFRLSAMNFLDEKVTALGWGLLGFNEDPSDVLEAVDLTVIGNGQCNSQMKEDILYNQMCTYTPGKDACQKDSGGPLVWFDGQTQRLQIVGIISFGLGCASTLPAVNTRVTSFLSWIASVTSDAHYCIK